VPTKKQGEKSDRKVIKIVATRCQIFRLKCTKSFVGWCSAPDPSWEFTALPRPFNKYFRVLLLMGWKRGKGGNGEKGREKRWKGRARRGIGPRLLGGIETTVQKDRQTDKQITVGKT